MAAPAALPRRPLASPRRFPSLQCADHYPVAASSRPAPLPLPETAAPTEPAINGGRRRARRPPPRPRLLRSPHHL
jgi:hypothetical protein